jgi:hypothetical protein
MSPDLGGVFQLLKEGDFSKDSGVLQLKNMGSPSISFQIRLVSLLEMLLQGYRTAKM